MSHRSFLLFLALLLLGGCSSVLGANFDQGPTASDGGTDALEETAEGSCAASCASPPPNTCLDAKTLRAYPPEGRCDGDLCTYVHYDIRCTNSCEDNACTGVEPCNGVVCVTPPAKTCADATTLTSFATSGICFGGKCSYTGTSTECAGGCANGACTGDPCAGLVCDQPPAATCADSTTRRGYTSPGTCTNGRCTSYPSTDTPCASGCTNGVCNGDPCAGVTCNQPPDPYCVNATTRRAYSSPAACSGGKCGAYPSSDTTCTTTVANADPTCVSGACDFACRSGYTRSGATCVSAPPPGSCTSDTDCVSPEKCGYLESEGCAAKGQCVPFGPSGCTDLVEACACNGVGILTGCNGFPSGYDPLPFKHLGHCP
jgi:hypothetical protein